MCQKDHWSSAARAGLVKINMMIQNNIDRTRTGNEEVCELLGDSKDVSDWKY
jgi:hypothetical protein